jgi:hypothetical protein
LNKLKLGALEDNKPVKITVELPAAIHRELVAYAETLSRETGQSISDPGKLISPMIERFMATDRGFVKTRREQPARHASTIMPKLPKHAT